MAFRKDLYGDDNKNAQIVYGDFTNKINFNLITETEKYYQDYHAQSEINNCHCGGGCPAYRRANTSYNTKVDGANVNREKPTKAGGRQFQKRTVPRKPSGHISRSISFKS